MPETPEEVPIRTIVEGMLPHGFLLDLGTYMQTVAHIELAVWQTVMHAEGIGLHSPEEFRTYIGLKLKTQELLDRFRGCASKCPPDIAAKIRDVANQIASGSEARNLAAHGAFYMEDETQGTLGAAHYFARGRGNAREFFEVQQTINRRAVEEAIGIANQLLHAVIDLRKEVIEWRYPDGMPEPTESDSEAQPSGWRHAYVHRPE
jgi:hypothetical protein